MTFERMPWCSRNNKEYWFKGVSRKYQGCFKEDWGVFQETLNGDSRELQRFLKEIQWAFKGTFKAVKEDVLRKFPACLKKLSSVFQENVKHSVKGVSRMFQWISVLQFCLMKNRTPYCSCSTHVCLSGLGAGNVLIEPLPMSRTFVCLKNVFIELIRRGSFLVTLPFPPDGGVSVRLWKITP